MIIPIIDIILQHFPSKITAGFLVVCTEVWSRCHEMSVTALLRTRKETLTTPLKNPKISSSASDCCIIAGHIP